MIQSEQDLENALKDFYKKYHGKGEYVAILSDREDHCDITIHELEDKEPRDKDELRSYIDSRMKLSENDEIFIIR